MNIGELMTTINSFVKSTDRLSAVVSSMTANKLSCALISDDGTPLGILTERDIVRIFAQCLSTTSLIDRAVSQVMTKDPMCLSTSTTLYDALVLARSHNVRHFPVVNDDDKMVGLVTQTNIVNAYIALMEKKAGLEKENEELKLLLHEDALMKIGNRRAMEVELDFTAATAKRYNKHYSIALLDVDWFKQYNDHYGHQRGDETLLAFASAIKTQLREADRVFRYGGEELLMLMPDTMVQEAINVAECARLAVESMMLPHSQSRFGFLTLSVGVALGGKEPWRDLVKQADSALYQAKDSGRNRVIAFS
ncbi:MAG: diguanylate cyclase (GGDEF)-like protein [Dinoroseobacter sp.]|jgi:diguanylate cyclase (GGDEF)-like protein